MSENQQPLTEQEQATAPAEAEQPDLPAGEDSTAAEGSETLAADEQPDIDPADVRIFGLRRVCFHFTAGGAAVGYIVCGLLGLLAENAPGTAFLAVPGVFCPQEAPPSGACAPSPRRSPIVRAISSSLHGFSRAATRSACRATARSNTLRTSRALPKFSSRSA